MPATIILSEEALALLRLHLAGQSPERASDLARPAYRELVKAGLMDPVSTFAGGPETLYRLTKAGYDLAKQSVIAPPGVFPLPR